MLPKALVLEMIYWFLLDLHVVPVACFLLLLQHLLRRAQLRECLLPSSNSSGRGFPEVGALLKCT